MCPNDNNESQNNENIPGTSSQKNPPQYEIEIIPDREVKIRYKGMMVKRFNLKNSNMATNPNGGDRP